MEDVNYNKEDLLDHHGVGAVIKNDKGEILMQEHTKYRFWTIPVGKVKKEQEVSDGLKEEIFEECNLIIEDYKEIYYRKHVYGRKGKKITVFEHLFEITKYSGSIQNKEPEKHKQQKFLDIEIIKKLPYLSDFTLLYLKTLGFERNPKLKIS